VHARKKHLDIALEQPESLYAVSTAWRAERRSLWSRSQVLASRQAVYSPEHGREPSRGGFTTSCRVAWKQGDQKAPLLKRSVNHTAVATFSRTMDGRAEPA
jgi:hypothetical protein